MEKKRVYEYAKEHKVSSKTVLDKAKQLGIDYHSHMSTMEDGDIKKLNQS
ncbi:MAG: translation initiation factor IF-2 N-terminal domain-containing protein, partial [Trichococcus flocculiformis]